MRVAFPLRSAPRQMEYKSGTESDLLKRSELPPYESFRRARKGGV